MATDMADKRKEQLEYFVKLGKTPTKETNDAKQAAAKAAKLQRDKKTLEVKLKAATTLQAELKVETEQFLEVCKQLDEDTQKAMLTDEGKNDHSKGFTYLEFVAATLD